MSNANTDSALRGRRVLIIEDEMLVAMELENVLRNHRCNVLGPAETVERAIALIGEGRPEAAVLDLHLNGQFALPGDGAECPGRALRGGERVQQNAVASAGTEPSAVAGKTGGSPQAVA